MKQTIGLCAVLMAGLTACSTEDKIPTVNAADYQVTDQASLHVRLQQLDQKFAQDFQGLKQQHNTAFSTQKTVTAQDLQQLHMHAVSTTSLKETKEAYCAVMNGYFSEVYRLGHFNLSHLANLKLLNVQPQDAQEDFANPEAFYNLVMDRATTYRQAQQTMGFGCNLKAALQFE